MAANAGFRTFAAGAVLTAAQINDYLMSQAVMTFASATARSAAITSPSEGMVTFLADTNTFWYYTGSSWFPMQPTLLRKTADQTVNASTTVVDDTDLQFSVAANEVWIFDAFLHMNGPTAGDFKPTFAGPAGSTITFGVIGQGAADATVDPNNIAAVTLIGNVAGAATVNIGASSNDEVVIMKGLIANGATAGTLKLRWAQVAASGSTILRAGSFMTANRMV